LDHIVGAGGEPVGRPPVLPAEEKLRIILAVLEARTTITRAAREHQVSETSIGNWKRQFLDAGRIGLESGRAPGGSAGREAELTAENEKLTTALSEAILLVRVWRMSAESRLDPPPTSR
jgi:transposase